MVKSFPVFCYLFFGLHICFLPFKWKFPLSRHDLKINLRGLEIGGWKMFTIRILIISNQWNLLGSKIVIISRISSFPEWAANSDSCLFFVEVVEKPVFTREHCSSRKLKSLNISPFFLQVYDEIIFVQQLWNTRNLFWIMWKRF